MTDGTRSKHAGKPAPIRPWNPPPQPPSPDGGPTKPKRR
ncbi:hypothetical protein SUDANB106_01881 [Streptomyces sp. enrichment culture]